MVYLSSIVRFELWEKKRDRKLRKFFLLNNYVIVSDLDEIVPIAIITK